MTLFKFVKAERVDILEKEKIAFTPPDRFNDAYEFRPHVAPVNRAFLKQSAKEYHEEVQRAASDTSLGTTRSERRRLARDAQKSCASRLKSFYAERAELALQAKASREIGVLSLTTSEHNERMWSCYADEHKGFVIEFDCSHPGFKQLGQPLPVKYHEKRAVFDPPQPNADYWLIKTIEWQYEHEFRIIRQLKECKEDVEIDGQRIYFFELPRLCVKAIYLGHRMNRAIRDRVLQAMFRSSAVKFEEIPSIGDGDSSYQEIR